MMLSLLLKINERFVKTRAGLQEFFIFMSQAAAICLCMGLVSPPMLSIGRRNIKGKVRV